MAIALIALYVLRENGVIVPTGCFVAVWAALLFVVITDILKEFCE